MVLLIGDIDFSSVLVIVHRAVTATRDQRQNFVSVEINTNHTALLGCRINSRSGWNGDITWPLGNRDLLDLCPFDIVEDSQLRGSGDPELVTTIGGEG